MCVQPVGEQDKERHQDCGHNEYSSVLLSQVGRSVVVTITGAISGTSFLRDALLWVSFP